MGTILGRMLRAVAKLIAAVFSLLFIPTAVVVLLLISVDLALLNADTYKRALAEQEIYGQVPALAAEQLAAMEAFISNPCAENPLVCRIDGASPELQACLTDALGEEALVEIGSFQREPTEAELQIAQPCLDQYGRNPADESSLAAASPEIRACVKQALGEEVFDTLLHDERPPTDGELEEMARCSQQPSGDSGSSGPGEEAGASESGGNPMAFMNNLAPEDWERLISTLLPPEDLRLMTEQALDQVFAFLDGEVDSAKISLVPLRDRLTGQAGQEIIELLLAAQPPCTEAQQAQLAVDVSGSEGDLELCRPQGDDSDALMLAMQRRFDALVAEIPDEAELIKPLPPTASSIGGGPLGDDPLAAFRILRRWLWLSLLIPLGLLLPVTVFGVRSRKGWLRWWGIPMLVAGLITFSLGIAAVPALEWAWAGFVADRIPPLLSSSISAIAHDLAVSVVHELAQWIMLYAGAVIVPGLAAIVGSSRVSPRRPEAVAVEQGGMP